MRLRVRLLSVRNGVADEREITVVRYRPRSSSLRDRLTIAVWFAAIASWLVVLALIFAFAPRTNIGDERLGTPARGSDG